METSKDVSFVLEKVTLVARHKGHVGRSLSFSLSRRSLNYPHDCHIAPHYLMYGFVLRNGERVPQDEYGEIRAPTHLLSRRER
jgi:hypothetical protein